MNKVEDVNTRRIIGIDFGSKRVGVAVSDPARKFAMPHSVIENKGNLKDLASSIKKIADSVHGNLDLSASEIVMGDSRDYKGKPNTIAQDANILADELRALGFKVFFEPEFLSSVQASRWQGKNDMIDASAAAIILQSFLDRNDRNSSGEK